jgi:hypothetical protein
MVIADTTAATITVGLADDLVEASTLTARLENFLELADLALVSFQRPLPQRHGAVAVALLTRALAPFLDVGTQDADVFLQR